MQKPFSLFKGDLLAHMEFDGGLIPNNNYGRPIVVDDTKAVPLAQEIMTLTSDHLPFRLAQLLFEFCPLAFDPPEPTYNRQSHRIIAEG